jgi:two-component system C4-dicarboxylate transport sensor histidine kinase DctB
MPLAPRAYYYAAPVFAPSGKTRGSVIVAVDLQQLEDAWRGDERAVFFADKAGIVFVSNRSELVQWRRRAGGTGIAPPDGPAPAFDSHVTGGHEIWELGWGPYLPQTALHLVQDLPIIGLSGEIMLDVAPAQRLARLQAIAVAGLCLAFGALLFLAMERRRTLAAANSQLESRVARRTAALLETNAMLRREAREREEAQAALARAQADLVQASKLSALGQMSAAISHELNQPLMAIGSFAENAVQFQDRGQADRVADNLVRISDMARRMGRIIRNLRAFSRQDTEPHGRVNLTAIVQSAIELLQPRLTETEVSLFFEARGPIFVRGGEVRLGQVFVNLISNALDAMQGRAQRDLRITVTEGARVQIDVEDTGGGIDAPEKVFDPFYSTKNVGAAMGMGLGLSISYGIVQSLGGDIRAQNTGQGARFSVFLDPMPHEEQTK